MTLVEIRSYARCADHESSTDRPSETVFRKTDVEGPDAKHEGSAARTFRHFWAGCRSTRRSGFSSSDQMLLISSPRALPGDHV